MSNFKPALVPELDQSKSAKCKLWSCPIVIFMLWLGNIPCIVLSFINYFTELNRHLDCWRCIFRSYIILTISVEFLTALILIAVIPLVVIRTSTGIRMYVTLLFLMTWLQMMLALLLSEEYQAIGDVIRMWKNGQSLAFFEDNYKCCGVLGSDDYHVIGSTPPKSCYENGSGSIEDLYTKGCSTVTVKINATSWYKIISLIVQFCMVLALVIYLVILKQTNTPMRTSEWRRPPPVMFQEM